MKIFETIFLSVIEKWNGYETLGLFFKDNVQVIESIEFSTSPA